MRILPLPFRLMQSSSIGFGKNGVGFGFPAADDASAFSIALLEGKTADSDIDFAAFFLAGVIPAPFSDNEAPVNLRLLCILRCEEGREFVSGIGNFGNLLCYENIEKSILYDKFVSPGHMLLTNKEAFDHLAFNMSNYSMAPTWRNLTKLMGTAVVDSFKGKDF